MEEDSIPLPSDPFSFVVAAGPFGSPENLRETVDYAISSEVDLLILVGPFVEEHEVEDELMTYAEHFSVLMEQYVFSRLRMVECPPQVVLQPSLKDMHHDMVYPQPPFPVGAVKGLPAGTLRCCPNPSILDVNNVIVASTSVDILMHINVEVLLQGSDPDAPLDRLSSFIHHMLCQRSFYPIYPSSSGVGSSSEGNPIPIDYSHISLAEIPRLPDILLVPSKLTQFVKVVDGVICVNPRQVSFGRSVAKVVIHPDAPSSSPSPSSSTGTTPLLDRTRVEIIRLSS